MNTSINLYQSIADEISTVSEKYGVSKSELVRMLVKKIKNFKSIKKVEGVLIEYQRKVNADCEYEIVHFSCDSKMCDYAKLLRFENRMSLSKFVCASFLFFWDEILRDIFGEEKEISNLLYNYEELVVLFKILIIYFFKRFNISISQTKKQE